MDSSVSKPHTDAGCDGPTPGYARLAATCCWCGFFFLTVLLAGCELFKPPSPSEDAAIRSFFQRETAQGPNPSPTLWASTPHPRAGTNLTAAQPAETTRGQLTPRAQAQSQPPGEAKTAPAEPAKGAEKLMTFRADSRAPMSDSTLRTTAAKGATATPSGIATAISRPVASQLIVKGPPRPRQRSWTWPRRPLLPAVGLAVLIAALAIYSNRGRLLPRARRKAGKEELDMPGEFKTKDSVIQAPTVVGMLVSERPRRNSISQGVLAVLALALSKTAALCAAIVSIWKVRREESPGQPSPPAIPPPGLNSERKPGAQVEAAQVSTLSAR